MGGVEGVVVRLCFVGGVGGCCVWVCKVAWSREAVGGLVVSLAISIKNVPQLWCNI